jgi:hypothetical protein
VHSFGPEDLIEGTGELRVAVSDQKPDVLKPLSYRQVAGLLGDPSGDRVPGDAQDMNTA